MEGETGDALDLHAGESRQQETRAGDGEHGQEVVGEDLEEQLKGAGHVRAS